MSAVELSSSSGTYQQGVDMQQQLAREEWNKPTAYNKNQEQTFHQASLVYLLVSKAGFDVNQSHLGSVREFDCHEFSNGVWDVLLLCLSGQLEAKKPIWNVADELQILTCSKLWPLACERQMQGQT